VTDNAAVELDKKSLQSKVDVSYFRNLIQSESVRLTMLCAVWRSTMDDVSDLSDEGNLLSSLTVKQLWHVCTDFVFLGGRINCTAQAISSISAHFSLGEARALYFHVVQPCIVCPHNCLSHSCSLLKLLNGFECRLACTIVGSSDTLSYTSFWHPRGEAKFGDQIPG